jgi:hypothetical protein
VRGANEKEKTSRPNKKGGAACGTALLMQRSAAKLT